MKIQCDVCNKHEASVFCTADEAALCGGCDHRVHHANKLASKHHRFSLLRPAPKHHPLCDICQEKRGFMFCQQDRAIMCKDCDFSVHSTNEHTLKHDRFLLTGLKLSPSPLLHYSSSSPPPPSKNSLFTPHSNSHPSSSSSSSHNNNNNNKVSYHQPLISKATALSATTPSSSNTINNTSSISEYLIETLPGWQVEDFLDSCSTPFGFFKNDEMLPLFDAGKVEGQIGSFSQDSIGIWVPQAPPPLVCSSQVIGNTENKEVTNNIKGGGRSSLKDDNYIVPQISPASNSKRPRGLLNVGQGNINERKGSDGGEDDCTYECECDDGDGIA
ncbi:hypothetical protein RJT34_25776 [Clitoria ternatea]|uniref:B box-type domain-containing protein n=1 Tax=Clitoria ternatea TaxID=43366 RepID=A0AAN9FQF9_CLITE